MTVKNFEETLAAEFLYTVNSLNAEQLATFTKALQAAGMKFAAENAMREGERSFGGEYLNWFKPGIVEEDAGTDLIASMDQVEEVIKAGWLVMCGPAHPYSEQMEIDTKAYIADLIRFETYAIGWAKAELLEDFHRWLKDDVG